MAITLEKEHEAVQSFDVVETKNEIAVKYAGSPEVDKLTTEIEVYNPDSIVKFGSSVADEISKASDVVLNGMNMKQLNDTGKMMEALSKVMDQFNISEVTSEPKGLKKLLGNAEKQLQKLIGKYDSFGKEIEKIYVQLKTYESEIGKSNQYLHDMFEANKDQYQKLELYILAGEQGLEEIQKAIEDEESKGSDEQFTLQGLQQAKQLLEQRIQDLRITENVAMQTVPMIKSMEFSNYNLMRKIDSAFIITLPVFKQSIAQAMLLKRQKIQADAMAALDAKTNELLLQNAQRSASQTAEITRMTSGSSIKIETIEESWKTIMNGITEAKQIQEEAAVKREQDKKRLLELKAEFEKRKQQS